MRVLGIETSCDETAVALYDTKAGLIAHEIYSQIALHNDYGGVVPELASRDHIKKLLPMIRQVLKAAELTLGDIDGIAYTKGPGLAGALMVGAAVAQGLALALECPIIGVHHMEGHLLAPLLETKQIPFPFVALLVSGGHTMLIKVSAIGRYELLGESIDDAAGEAFDKTAKILGLPYPGGAHLAKLAEEGESNRFKLPRPMCVSGNLNFSFSGLKTAALHVLKEIPDSNIETMNQYKKDLAASFQQAVVDTLIYKCEQALKLTGFKHLVIAGGVSANQSLRTRLQTLSETQGFEAFYPRLEFCTDNAAMIALAGALRLERGEQDAAVLEVRARWPLMELG